MDKWEALHSFWSSFSIPAYEENSVPDKDDLIYPYITYEAVDSGFDSDVNASASVWSRSFSWLAADTISNTIYDRLKNGGETILYDGGMIWITAGTPFSHSMGDPEDDRIKRKLLSIDYHFA